MLGVAMLSCLTGSALTANWNALRKVAERQHVLLGGLVALLLLWLLTLEVIEDVRVHLLGVTSLTLIVGWRFNMIGATLVYVLIQQQPLAAAPLAWLFSVFIPATTTRLLAHVLRRHGLRNLFVYMLGAGFGGGILCVLMVAMTALPVFWLLGQTEWIAMALESWPFILLLMFPEGFINGMLVTAFTVFYPDVVKTFDDEYYLKD